LNFIRNPSAASPAAACGNTQVLTIAESKAKIDLVIVDKANKVPTDN
jgi:hypothetical protein